jgi:methionine synthase II (cobalamin-independent)
MSEERFLTTHVGSLPRAEDLITMIFAREVRPDGR